jgi:hypothetical protein
MAAPCHSPSTLRSLPGRADVSKGHTRHHPELTPLYQLIETHLPAFLDHIDPQGGLPDFVQQDFEDFLDCGIPDKGCAVLECPDCGHTKLVPFSCKRRGFSGCWLFTSSTASLLRRDAGEGVTLPFFCRCTGTSADAPPCS